MYTVRLEWVGKIRTGDNCLWPIVLILSTSMPYSCVPIVLTLTTSMPYSCVPMILIVTTSMPVCHAAVPMVLILTTWYQYRTGRKDKKLEWLWHIILTT